MLPLNRIRSIFSTIRAFGVECVLRTLEKKLGKEGSPNRERQGIYHVLYVFSWRLAKQTFTPCKSAVIAACAMSDVSTLSVSLFRMHDYDPY
jgi:hypothetical protein